MLRQQGTLSFLFVEERASHTRSPARPGKVSELLLWRANLLIGFSPDARVVKDVLLFLNEADSHSGPRRVQALEVAIELSAEAPRRP